MLGPEDLAQELIRAERVRGIIPGHIIGPETDMIAAELLRVPDLAAGRPVGLTGTVLSAMIADQFLFISVGRPVGLSVTVLIEIVRPDADPDPGWRS